jgi:hypothetical protein
VSFIYVVDIYEGNTIFFGYLFFITAGILCVQSLGHVIGIIFSQSTKMSVLFSVGIYVLFLIFCNFLIPVKEFHYSLQWFSNLSTAKLSFTGLIILFYGFDRCSGNEFSSIMYLFDLEDNHFYNNVRLLIIQFILLRSFALIILLIKSNPFSGRKKAQELHELAVNSLKPPKALIPGLSSHFEFKIKV